ncbi:uncharacterized protein LOC143557433 isoform X2 [Bidens hawaiensis]|uniref:uncharacterized protein LOC143557433 isoform X2 n=1 Tax=Bidens hawaiensis TaxID=980011 RepID=UPI00404B40E5
MISIDEHPPPDPSSSDNQIHHLLQQLSHEAFAYVSDLDLLKPSDGNLDDTNNSPLPNFSIRDYVFKSRCKDIAGNWPFSDKSLQLCLNYGVKNLLPPFQSLDSVRNYSSVSICAVENHSPNDESISNFDSKRKDNSLAHTKTNSQPTVKKYSKLVTKLNSGVEPIEETVASKVCPVCKTFSSSSNTTLNAHIDSCLSEESGMKQTEDLKLKTIKQYRIKPRKTRLMVDVYKTAPRCTIEELDRRNGTNWVTNSSFPDQEIEFQAEEKEKDQPQEPVFTREVADHEGAVYIDKNGKKVRILSMPKLNKVLIKKKKKKKAYMQKNSKKILKLTPNSKKLSQKVESGQKENAAIKESANPIKAQVNKQTDDLAVTRPPWACSKRTGGAKKRLPVHTRRKEDTRVDDSSDSSIRSKGTKFSNVKRSLSMPANRELDQEPKLITLKRKFSAIQKSQDSLKQRSMTEEDTSNEMSLEMTNVREVKRKKSITSESSTDDDSLSGGLDITSESARTEDCIGIEPSFTGLKNSFDNEFSTMISQLDNKFDSRQRTLNDIIMDHNNEKQGDYYNEVDPIPIPGPPGSFLPPSPGADMGSEEGPQDNSSLTTMSRVQSSEDRRGHDIMNQDFVSGSSISTVSSPAFDKNTANNNIIINNNTSDLRSVDAIFKEKSVTPCCCSRKEGAFFNNVTSYPQEPNISKERVTEPNGLRRPESFPLANNLTLPPPGMVKSPVISPTTLRLMGKNLTVVNTDDQQVKPSFSSPMGQYQQLQKFSNENRGSFFYDYPQNQNGSSMNQCFNLYPSNNSRSQSDILRSANMNNTATATKEIIVIDDSSDNEPDDHRHHIFKEPAMIRNHTFSFANQYGNGSMQASSHLQEVVNDGNHRGGWVSTAYYPRNFS